MLTAESAIVERAAPAALRVLRGLRLLIVADSSTTHTHRWAKWARDGGADVTVLSTFPDPIDGVTVVHFPGAPRWYHRIPKLRMLADYPRFELGMMMTGAPQWLGRSYGRLVRMLGELKRGVGC